jgi:hypothetical protein
VPSDETGEIAGFMRETGQKGGVSKNSRGAICGGGPKVPQVATEAVGQPIFGLKTFGKRFLTGFTRLTGLGREKKFLTQRAQSRGEV